MSAALTLTPSSCRLGQAVVVSGTDFAVSTKVRVECSSPLGGVELSHDIDSDAGGDFGSTDIANPAVATLTSDGANVTAADTVTIGAVTYTFRASVSTTANEVLIGADAATSLANLKAAINLEAGSGTKYGSATVVHPTVECDGITATTLSLVAKTKGTAGNSLASTEASTHLSFGGTTFSGGAAATGEATFRLTPQREGIWTVTATDGTSTVTAQLTVYAGGA